ncbi:inner membrane protein YhjD [Pseudonocardia acaciae]|uniref:inner membrane protein YhjD n=1 Tax=Pseudonocardia acaciae TaxID=551276 RepID=UPI00048F454C|nr:inner membrane protein YhjD [Pseudonocardia acaciae]
MTSTVSAGSGRPSKLTELRARHHWLDHLLRAAQRYGDKHGDHYAAAITYFSVLALVPLLMVAFAVAAFFLRAHPELIGQLKASVTKVAPPGMDVTLGGIVDQAIASAGTVGVIGLLAAAYSGLGWMSNLREALSEQWGQRTEPPTFLRRLAVDLLALVGLGVALVLSVAVGVVGGLAGPIANNLGLGDVAWLSPLIWLAALVAGLLASSLVFLWVIARLPREPVSWRSATKAALIGSVGFEVIKQVMIVYVAEVTNSPTGAAFGPILGLLIFVFTVSRFVLFLTAWAATARENEQTDRRSVPGPAVIRTDVVVRNGIGAPAAVGLVGAGVVTGVVAGLVGGFLRLRRRRDGR